MSNRTLLIVIPLILLVAASAVLFVAISERGPGFWIGYGALVWALVLHTGVVLYVRSDRSDVNTRTVFIVLSSLYVLFNAGLSLAAGIGLRHVSNGHHWLWVSHVVLFALFLVLHLVFTLAKRHISKLETDQTERNAKIMKGFTR